jgi:hypothetical protein
MQRNTGEHGTVSVQHSTALPQHSKVRRQNFHDAADMHPAAFSLSKLYGW